MRSSNTWGLDQVIEVNAAGCFALAIHHDRPRPRAQAPRVAGRIVFLGTEFVVVIVMRDCFIRRQALTARHLALASDVQAGELRARIRDGRQGSQAADRCAGHQSQLFKKSAPARIERFWRDFR